MDYQDIKGIVYIHYSNCDLIGYNSVNWKNTELVDNIKLNLNKMCFYKNKHWFPNIINMLLVYSVMLSPNDLVSKSGVYYRSMIFICNNINLRKFTLPGFVTIKVNKMLNNQWKIQCVSKNYFEKFKYSSISILVCNAMLNMNQKITKNMSSSFMYTGNTESIFYLHRRFCFL